MDIEEVKKELEALLPKLEDETMTQEEESRFMKLYQKYAKMVEDEVAIESIKQQL